MHRLLPIEIARAPDDNGPQRAIINTTFSFAILITGIVGVGIMVFGPLVSDSIPTNVYYLLGVAVVVQQLVVLSDQLATSLGRYGVASAANVATSIVGLVLGVAGMLAFGVGGLLLSQICWGALGLIMIIYPLKLAFQPMLSFGVLRELIGTGITTVGNGLIFLGFKSLDRIAILVLLGTVALGYYGLALAAASLIEMIFQPIGRVTLQRSATVYARSQNLLAVWRRVTRILIGQMVVFSILAGIMVLWLPVIVHFILPDYEPARAATSILLFGMVAFSLRSTLVYYHLAIGRLVRTYPMQIAVLAVGGVFLWLTMEWYPSITTAAIAASIVYAFASIIFAAYSFRTIDESVAFSLRSGAYILLPVIYTSVETFMLVRIMMHLDVSQDFVSLVLASIMFTVTFIVLQVPVLIFAERTIGLVSELLSLTMNLYQRIRNQRPDGPMPEVSP